MQINVCVSEENTFLVENLLSLFPPLTPHTAATESIKQSCCDPKIKKKIRCHINVVLQIKNLVNRLASLEATLVRDSVH